MDLGTLQLGVYIIRILLVDTEAHGQFLDLALRCIEYGHEVRLWHPKRKGLETRDGEGFKGLRIVSDWRDHMTWVGRDGLIAIPGNNMLLTELDRYRDMGFKIFGPTKSSADMEINREAGMKAMESVGIELPPYQMFKSLEDAAAFARKSDDSWVFKNLGSEEDKSLSYVSSSPADMVAWIGAKIKRGLVLRGPCMLQQKIDMLSEFGVSGWMGPEGFLPNRWNENVEHKKLMNDEIGPTTGEMCNVSVYCEESRLADEILKPCEPIFRALGHMGDLAVGVGVDTKGKAWPFEWTARCGWPAFHIQTASHKGDPAQWMRDLMDGKDSLKVSRDIALGVVMAQKPFPYDEGTFDNSGDLPIYGIDEVWDDIHPCAVMLGKGPIMKGGKVVDGPVFKTTSSYVLVATGLGKTITQARERVYNTVKKVKFSDSIYRTDAGLKVIKALPELQKHGHALDFKA